MPTKPRPARQYRATKPTVIFSMADREEVLRILGRSNQLTGDTTQWFLFLLPRTMANAYQEKTPTKAEVRAAYELARHHAEELMILLEAPYAPLLADVVAVQFHKRSGLGERLSLMDTKKSVFQAVASIKDGCMDSLGHKFSGSSFRKPRPRLARGLAWAWLTISASFPSCQARRISDRSRRADDRMVGSPYVELLRWCIQKMEPGKNVTLLAARNYGARELRNIKRMFEERTKLMIQERARLTLEEGENTINGQKYPEN